MPPDETNSHNPEAPPAKERPTPPAPTDDKSKPANDAREKDADALAPILPERISIDARELADALIKRLQKYPGVVVVESGPKAQEEKLSTRERVKKGAGRFFKGLGGFLKDFGPPLTGFATAAVAALVFYYGHQFQDRQATTAADEAYLKILTEFSNSFEQLNNSNAATKTLAANRLALYGERALEPIKINLATEEKPVRDGAVLVVFQMFQAETVERSKLMDSLRGYFEKSNSPYLRTGVIECFLKIAQYLPDEEKRKVVAVLRDKLRPEDCTRKGEEETIENATIFLAYSPSRDSVELLLKIAGSDCKFEPRHYAIDSLPKAAAILTPPERTQLLKRLEEIRGRAPSELIPFVDFAVGEIQLQEGR